MKTITAKKPETAVIVPGMMDEYIWLAKAVFSPEVVITSNAQKVISMAKKGLISQILVIMGGKLGKKPASPKEIYNLLKPLKIKVVTVTGWDWKIPNQYYIPSMTAVKDLKKKLKI